MRDAIFINQDIRPDNLRAMAAKTFHQEGIAFEIDIFDDPENSFFRIDSSQCAIFGDPELGKIVTDEIRTDHRRCGFAATGRRCTGKKGLSAVGSGHAGYKHMFRELLLNLVIGAIVNTETVIPLFQQERVSGVCAEGGKGCHPASVHENPGIGDIFWRVFTFRMNIGEEKPGPFNLGIELFKTVPIENFGRMKDVG